MATLEERMALHTAGQITWPKPEAGKACTDCRHFGPFNVSKAKQEKGFGRCGLVKGHTRKEGLQFKGASAIACSMFDPK